MATFANHEVQGKVVFTKTLLRRFRVDPPDTRKPWIRFAAIRADKAISAPMNPRVENGSVLLIDRHYCSLAAYRKDEPNMYLIHKDEAYMVRRVEMQGSQLCLRPENPGYQLDFISIDAVCAGLDELSDGEAIRANASLEWWSIDSTFSPTH